MAFKTCKILCKVYDYNFTTLFNFILFKFIFLFNYFDKFFDSLVLSNHFTSTLNTLIVALSITK